MSVTDATWTSRCAYPVLVEANVFQMRIVEQLFWVDVDWRLAFAFTAQAPFRVHEAPKFWPCNIIFEIIGLCC